MFGCNEGGENRQTGTRSGQDASPVGVANHQPLSNGFELNLFVCRELLLFQTSIILFSSRLLSQIWLPQKQALDAFRVL